MDKRSQVKHGAVSEASCRASHGEVLARPHFAKWLAENGYAKSPGEAFAKYLHPCSPSETRCYEERYHPPQEETFRAVHEAGGICVMAHPKFWRFEWRKSGSDFDVAARELARLKVDESFAAPVIERLSQICANLPSC